MIDKTRPGFIIEDVYNSCTRGASFILCTYTEDGELGGFSILGEETDGFSQSKSLMVWCAYAKKSGAVEATIPQIEAFARQFGYQYITMHSNRPGWLKMGPKLGFKLREHVLVKKVEV